MEHRSDCDCIHCEEAWFERREYERHLDKQAMREAEEDLARAQRLAATDADGVGRDGC